MTSAIPPVPVAATDERPDADCAEDWSEDESPSAWDRLEEVEAALSRCLLALEAEPGEAGRAAPGIGPGRRR